jgi:hypothetical protein
MATATRRHSIMNPARRSRPKARKNKARRHMSAKQIRHFGTKAQKAALKRKRSAKAKHNRPKHRTRTRKNAVARTPRKAPRMQNRKRTVAKKRNARRRSNPGEILSLTLGNPAKRRSMAARKAKRNASARRTNARHHHRKHHRKNAGHRVRHHRVLHRRNAGAMNVTNLFTEGLSALVGMAGSRLLTQAVLGSSNIGAYGYAGNAAATAVLAGLAHMFFKGKPAVRDGIIIGGAAGILARAMSDYTPIGTYLTQAGFAGMPAGDYAGGGAAGLGLYMPTNAVNPARFVGSSAWTEMPDGWGPQPVAPASAGVGAYGRGRAGRY